MAAAPATDERRSTIILIYESYHGTSFASGSLIDHNLIVLDYHLQPPPIRAWIRVLLLSERVGRGFGRCRASAAQSSCRRRRWRASPGSMTVDTTQGGACVHTKSYATQD